MKLHSLKYICLVSVSLLFLNCTRPETESSTVTMQLPSAASFQKSSLNNKIGTLSSSSNNVHIALNVTSPDGFKIFCSYDSDKQTSTGPCLFTQTSVTVDVAPGADRLFQVFYAVDTSNGISMNYGDQLQSISGASANVSINLSQIGANSTFAGNISGRYIEGTAAIPTYSSGILEAKYNPGSGKPLMTIWQTEMYQGWFKTLTLQGVNLSYEVAGKNIFTEVNSGLAFDYTALTTYLAITANSSRSITTTDGSHVEVIGWFGPGRSGTQATYTAVAALCDGTTNKVMFVDCLVNSSTEKSKFAPPFAQTGTSPNQFLTQREFLSPNYYFTSQLLPGITIGGNPTDDLSEVKIFKLTNITSPDQIKPYFIDDNRWNCAALDLVVPAAQKWTANYNVNASTRTGLLESASDTISSIHLNSNDVLFFCPVSGGNLKTSSIVYPDIYNGYGHGGYSGPYLHLNIMGQSKQLPGDVRGLTKNECYQLQIGSYQGHGSNYMMQNSITVDLSSAAGLFYSDGSCSTPQGSPQLSISSAMYTSSGALYFKPNVGGINTIDLTTTSTEVLAEPQDIDVRLPSLVITAPSKMDNLECAQAVVTRYDGFNDPIADPVNPISLTLTPTAGLGLFSDIGCSSSLSTPQIAVNFSNVKFYIKRTTSSGTESIGFNTSTHLPSQVLTNGLNINTRTSSSITTSIKLSVLSTEILPGMCLPIKATLFNAANEEVLTNTDMTFALAARGIGFYSSPGCYGETSGDFVIPAKSSYVLLYARILVSGALTLDLARETTDMVSFDSSYTATFPVSNTNPAISFMSGTLPDWRNRVVGSHEFKNNGSARELQLSTNSTSEIKCYQSIQTPESWNPCPGGTINQTTKKFLWDISSATLNLKFKFTIENNGYAEFFFNPSDFFSQKFMIKECDFILNGNTLTRSDLSDGFSNPNNGTGANSGTNQGVVCLGQSAIVNVTDSNVNPSGTIAGGKPALIGFIGNNATDRSTVNFSNSYVLKPIRGGSTAFNFTMANVNLTSTGPSNIFQVDEGSETSAGKLSLNNLRFSALSPTSPGGSLLQIKNIEMTRVYLDEIYFDPNHASSSWSVKALELEDVKFNSTPNSESGFIARNLLFANTAIPLMTEVPIYIQLSNVDLASSSQYNFERVQMSGRAQAIKLVNGNTNGVSTNINRLKADLPLTAATGVISMTGNSQLRIENSYVASGAVNVPIVNIDPASQSINEQISLFNNRFELKVDASMIKGTGLTGTMVPTIFMVGNHFIRSTTNGSTSKFIDFSSLTGGSYNLEGQWVNAQGATIYTDTSNGKNRICSDSVSRAWTSLNYGSAAASGSNITMPAATIQASGFMSCLNP